MYLAPKSGGRDGPAGLRVTAAGDRIAVRTSTVILVGLLAFSPVAAPQRRQDGGSAAALLVAAARREARRMAPSVAAEDLTYIANQESEGGLAAEQDFVEAFEAARRLPAADGELKARLEAGVIGSLLEAGELSLAERMASEADAGFGAILDRLIPEEIAAGREPEAWREWGHRNGGMYPYLAAEALAGVARAGTGEQELWAEGVAATGRSGDLADAEIAAEFLELAGKAAPDEKEQISAAALRLAQGLPGMEGAPGFAVAALRVRLRAVVEACDPGRLGQFDGMRVAGGLRARPPGATPTQPAPAEKAPEGGAPDARSPTFPEMAGAAAAVTGGPNFFQEKNERQAMKMLTPAIAAEFPLAVARLAVGAFELERLADAQVALRLALNEAERRAKTVAPGGRIAISSSAVLAVFGIAGEIDFPLASRRALALQAGPMRPLVLAHVARMAGASARWRPGKAVAVLH